MAKRKHYFQVHKNKRPRREISSWNTRKFRKVVRAATKVVAQALDIFKKKMKKRPFPMPKYKSGYSSFNQGGIIGGMDFGNIRSKQAILVTGPMGDKVLVDVGDSVKFDKDLRLILEKHSVVQVCTYNHFTNPIATIEKGNLIDSLKKKIEENNQLKNQ